VGYLSYFAIYTNNPSGQPCWAGRGAKTKAPQTQQVMGRLPNSPLPGVRSESDFAGLIPDRQLAELAVVRHAQAQSLFRTVGNIAGNTAKWALQ
jgi:hypothetical protein